MNTFSIDKQRIKTLVDSIKRFNIFLFYFKLLTFAKSIDYNLKNDMLMKTNEMYESPSVEVIEVEVEKGFAASLGQYEEEEDL